MLSYLSIRNRFVGIASKEMTVILQQGDSLFNALQIRGRSDEDWGNAFSVDADEKRILPRSQSFSETEHCVQLCWNLKVEEISTAEFTREKRDANGSTELPSFRSDQPA